MEKKKFSFEATIVEVETDEYGWRMVSGLDDELREHFPEREWEHKRVRVTVEEL